MERTPTYDFAKNSEKMHEIEKILVRSGSRSANEYINYCALTNIHLVFFTARKRCLGQGNVFTPVRHSVHKGEWSPLDRDPPRERPPGQRPPGKRPPHTDDPIR